MYERKNKLNHCKSNRNSSNNEATCSTLIYEYKSSVRFACSALTQQPENDTSIYQVNRTAPLCKRQCNQGSLEGRRKLASLLCQLPNHAYIFAGAVVGERNICQFVVQADFADAAKPTRLPKLVDQPLGIVAPLVFLEWQTVREN